MKTNTGLILYNAKIYTVDPAGTIAGAMAVKDGKVLATGSTQDILGRYKSENILDAGGKAVFPGFIDAHCHFYGYALNFRSIVLNGSNSFQEVLNRLQKAGTPAPGKWVVGRGWDNNLWKVKFFPDCKALDDLYPDNPVVLIRIDGHAVLANSKALQMAGIGVHHSFIPDEVEIENGRLTGILKENAADHMRQAVPKPDPEVIRKLIDRAREDCFSVGLTTVSDAGLDAATVRLYDSLSSGKDSAGMIRIYAMLEPSIENIGKYISKGPYRTPRLAVSSVKVYSDGSLGSRTALMKQFYHDMPGQHGIRVITADSLRKICKLCFDHGYQVNTHAIGDSANKFVLDIYGEYLKGENDRRWRIEHCQVVDPTDIGKFKKYSVIPSVQATHATSDMGWAKDRLGDERIRWAYAYKNLMKQNGWIANGTDFPIENISPIYTFYAAVARKDLKGNPPGGFLPENALSREEALRSITIWAARADRWEDKIGSLEPGKNADFVIVDKDIMQINEDEIPLSRVISTYLSGKQVYKKP